MEVFMYKHMHSYEGLCFFNSSDKLKLHMLWFNNVPCEVKGNGALALKLKHLCKIV